MCKKGVGQFRKGAPVIAGGVALLAALCLQDFIGAPFFVVFKYTLSISTRKANLLTHVLLTHTYITAALSGERIQYERSDEYALYKRQTT